MNHYEYVCSECAYYDPEDSSCRWFEDQCIDDPPTPHVHPSDGGCEHWHNQAYADERAAYLADAHNCRDHDNGIGYCSWCGAIIPGSSADYSEHGYDPPDTID